MSSRRKSSKKGAVTRAEEKRIRERKRLKNILKILSVLLLLSGVIAAFSFFASNDKNSTDKNSSTKNRIATEKYSRESKKDNSSHIKISDVSVPEEYPEEDSEHFSLLNILKSHKGDEKSSRCIIVKSNRPKLVIIIDDISHKSQLNAIDALPYHITASIFPPSKLSMHSNNLAKGRKHYMVHLPMQSGSRQFNKMYKTLFVSDSEEKMKKRVKEIRELFPNDIFINNHTGSVFTSDYKAMKRLYGLLRANGFVFVDSRTTGRSSVKKICKEYKDLYIYRDIFLDNKQSISYIQSQLKKAVKIAKHRGYAIAIGHPHNATFRALAKSKNILKDVEVVYIDELVKLSSD